MNQIRTDLHALLQSIQEGEDPETVRDSIRLWVPRLISGNAVVLGQDGTLTAAAACDWLIHSLDVAYRVEIVRTADEYITSYFDNEIETLKEDPTTLRNLIGVCRDMLDGRAIFARILRYCRDILLSRFDISIDVQVEAAKFLYDTRNLGDDPDFWLDVGSRQPGQVKLLPTAALALMERWPALGLDFLLKQSIALSDEDQYYIANVFSLTWRHIAASTTADDYRRIYLEYRDLVSEELVLAMQGLAQLRGWQLESGVPGPSSTEITLVPATLRDGNSSSLNNVSETTRARLFKDWGVRIAADLHFEAKSRLRMQQGVIAFPSLQLQKLQSLRSEANGGITAADLGHFELGLVRGAVRQELEEGEHHDNAQDGETMLHAVQERVPACDPYAAGAAEQLIRLGFDRRSFNLGETEYHQDRLMMNIVAAALVRAGLMGAQVERRPWESKGFNLWKQHKQAHLVMRAKPTLRPTTTGVFRFEGFRVFVRLDGVRRYVDLQGNEEVVRDARELLSAVEQGVAASDALTIKARARLALSLGLAEARGSSFEDLRTAIANLAQLKVAHRAVAQDMRNDDAFESFITGRSSIYCGGAINSRLIDTWWSSSNKSNFVAILNHDDIAGGFQSERITTRGKRSYIENALHFSGLGDTSKRGEVKATERALIDLFRAVGQGLQSWSKAVMADPHQLNGLTPSCAAARRILGPQHEAGHYAFVTTLADPAALIHHSDTFYRTDGTLPN